MYKVSDKTQPALLLSLNLYQCFNAPDQATLLLGCGEHQSCVLSERLGPGALSRDQQPEVMRTRLPRPPLKEGINAPITNKVWCVGSAPPTSQHLPVNFPCYSVPTRSSPPTWCMLWSRVTQLRSSRPWSRAQAYQYQFRTDFSRPWGIHLFSTEHSRRATLSLAW